MKILYKPGSTGSKKKSLKHGGIQNLVGMEEDVSWCMVQMMQKCWQWQLGTMNLSTKTGGHMKRVQNLWPHEI